MIRRGGPDSKFSTFRCGQRQDDHRLSPWAMRWNDDPSVCSECSAACKKAWSQLNVAYQPHAARGVQG